VKPSVNGATFAVFLRFVRLFSSRSEDPVKLPKNVVAMLFCGLTFALAGCANNGSTYESRAPRPEGAEALRVPVPGDSIYLFNQRKFGGNVTQVHNVTTSHPGGKLHLVEGSSDTMTSLRWNLPPGVAVVFYEDAGGRGNQMGVWGAGEVESVSQWNFNDRVSRWAWFYVGGVPNPSPVIQAGMADRPLGATPTGPVAPGAIELFRDTDFKGPMTTVGPIRSSSANDFHQVGAASNSMSSLRWNLPPGVVVILYEDAQGRGRQIPLWGSGEFSTVTPWNFNDSVSRWAWFDVSALER
jgi:hypothetical protein